MAEAVPEPVTSSVDETPISPIENKESLEKQLKLRSDAQDLKNRHILLDTTAAPALQAQQQELQRQKLADSLKKGLEHRPEREELVERNILPDTSVAPALQSHQRQLSAAMRRNSIEKHLQHRPTPETLVKEGILEADEVPSA